MTMNAPGAMSCTDFAWAAQLMERRRARYAAYSPVFWRPRAGIADFHAQFLRACSERVGAVALRTEHGFILSGAQQGRCAVDDFAVDDDALWATEGRELLLAAWRAARCAEQHTLRVVSARRDESKRRMLIELGLAPASRWWVKELVPTAVAAAHGPIKLGDIDAQLVAAPPVYDPGGPVCLLGALDPERAVEAAERAAGAGAVLAIMQREAVGSSPAASEPLLQAAGYHNPAEFYDGQP